MEFGVSARGQHQEFLVGLTADEEQQCRLPGFVRYANFRFRLHRQFEQIPETDFGGPDIWFHVLRITRLYLDPDGLQLVDDLEAEHRRRFVTQNCGGQFQCDDEGYRRNQQLDGYVCVFE